VLHNYNYVLGFLSLLLNKAVYGQCFR